MPAGDYSDGEFVWLIIIVIVLMATGMWPLGVMVGLFLVAKNIANRIS